MILDLIANTGKGADKAKKDLKGVKDAAKGLKGSAGAGPDKLRKDLEKLTPAARKAARELAIASHRERQIGRDGGVAKTTRQLDQATRAAKNLNKELARKPAANTVAMIGGRPRGGASPKPSARPAGKMPPYVAGGFVPVAPRRWAGRGSGRASGPATAAASAAEGGGAALMAAGRAFAPAVGAYMGWQGVKAAGRNTVGKSISFESAMADVKRKVDLPAGGSYEQIEKWIDSAAIRFGKSRTEVASLVAELGAAGIGYNDLSRAIELNTKASVAWDMTAGDTGNTMAKIRAGQNLTMAQLEEFGDKVNAVADAGASKESDLVEMYQRAGASGEISGLDMDTSLAFLAGMNSSGIQPEIAARGFSAMVSKLRTASTGGTDKMEQGFGLLGLTGEQIEKGMMKDGVKTLHDFIGRFQKAKDQAGAATLIFGQGWWDEWSRMVKAMPEIQKYLALLGDESKWRGSMGNNLNIELKTTKNHMERLSALTEKVGDHLGRWLMPPINDAINKVIKTMDEFDAAAEKRKQADEAGKRIAAGQPLTDEQLRMKVDPDAAKRIEDSTYAHGQKIRSKHIGVLDKRIEADRGNAAKVDLVLLRERNKARLKLDRDIAAMEEVLKKAGHHPDRQRQLEHLRGRRGKLGAMEADEPETVVDPKVRAYRAERDRLIGERKRLADAQTADPANAPGYKRLISGDNQSLQVLNAKLRRDLAPSLTAIHSSDKRFSGAPIGDGNSGSIGSTGLTAFGLSGGGRKSEATRTTKGKTVRGAGAGWANRSLTDFDVDIGHELTVPLGDKIAESIAASGGKVQAATQGLVDGAKTILASADMSAAGQQAAASYANGLLAGVPQVAAAAGKLKAAATSGMSGFGGGGLRIGGALHDGVE
ncbi:hypothetical protein GCM10019059_35040 [Camelimonas fluminis]|nr:hypothetical protein GCM10019059_35040 [Camelimonas fluminis]